MTRDELRTLAEDAHAALKLWLFHQHGPGAPGCAVVLYRVVDGNGQAETVTPDANARAAIISAAEEFKREFQGHAEAN